MKPQTVQIVRQGEATPYWFKFNPLYLQSPDARTKLLDSSETEILRRKPAHAGADANHDRALPKLYRQGRIEQEGGNESRKNGNEIGSAR